jgi:hypothetical protein
MFLLVTKVVKQLVSSKAAPRKRKEDQKLYTEWALEKLESATIRQTHRNNLV